MTNDTNRLLVCVDGSSYTDAIIHTVIWLATQLNRGVDLLHVVPQQSDYAGSVDHTGTIGIDAKQDLMKALVSVETARSQLDQEKGQLILDHCHGQLVQAGLSDVRRLHRRGRLVQTILAFENQAKLIVIGKRGEASTSGTDYLGSNLETVARSVHKPVYLVSRTQTTGSHRAILIAYDGKETADQAIEFTCTSDLFRGSTVHVITVNQPESEPSNLAVKKLESAGYNVRSHHTQGSPVSACIQNYVDHNKIDLLLIGAYSHARIRTMILGSTTEQIIKSCHIPIVLFK